MSHLSQIAALEDVAALDVAFVLDTTGSMGPLLQAARQHMTALLKELRGGANLHVGFVEYRDHHKTDAFVTRVHPFTPDLSRAQKNIESFKADGGGDGPEAVFDGIVVAIKELEWRRHARRIAVLIGDAPPHGVGASGDHFPQGCPCGETTDSVTAQSEEARVTLYAIGLMPHLEQYFKPLATTTGGEFWASHPAYGHRNHQARSENDPIARLKTLLTHEFGNLEFDAHVLEAVRASPEAGTDVLAENLASSRSAIAASLTRLGQRELLD